MERTIVWTKGGYYGTGTPTVRVADTVRATLMEIGKGHITVSNVVWCVNSQFSKADNGVYEMTEAQVKRVLDTLVRESKDGYCDRRFRHFHSLGHGCYRWE